MKNNNGQRLLFIGDEGSSFTTRLLVWLSNVLKEVGHMASFGAIRDVWRVRILMILRGEREECNNIFNQF